MMSHSPLGRCPQLQADETVRLVNPRCEHDDGHILAQPHATADLQPVHTRQHPIQHHEVWRVVPGQQPAGGEGDLEVVGELVDEDAVALDDRRLHRSGGDVVPVGDDRADRQEHRERLAHLVVQALVDQFLDENVIRPGQQVQEFLANFTQAKIEERYDVGRRFEAEYRSYKRTTPPFGPVWFWAGVLGAIACFSIVPWLCSFR